MFRTTADNTNQHEEINPFDLNWLSEHFGLDINEVLSAKWDTLTGALYQIKFKNLIAAERFYETMEQHKFSPQIWEISNTVELNKHSKPSIINATKQPSKLVEDREKLSDQGLVSSVPTPKAVKFSPEWTINSYTKEYSLKSTVTTKHINLALSSKNNEDFIIHWIHAFQLTAPSAIGIYKYDEEISAFEHKAVSVAPDFIEEHRIINCFIKALFKADNIKRLNSLFSQVSNWDEFYSTIPQKEQAHAIQFICFINDIKDQTDTFAIYVKIAIAALYNQANPYRRIKRI